MCGWGGGEGVQVPATLAGLLASCWLLEGAGSGRGEAGRSGWGVGDKAGAEGRPRGCCPPTLGPRLGFQALAHPSHPPPTSLTGVI